MHFAFLAAQLTRATYKHHPSEIQTKDAGRFGCLTQDIGNAVAATLNYVKMRYKIFDVNIPRKFLIFKHCLDERLREIGYIFTAADEGSNETEEAIL